jgi:hypothetical protein
MSGGSPYSGRPQRRIEACQDVGGQLQARNDACAAAHVVEIFLAGAPDRRVTLLRFRCDAGHVHHQARIDPMLARGGALTAVGAHLSPTLGVRRAGAAREKIENTIGDSGGIGRIETGGLDHRAGFDALPTASACIQHVIGAQP